MIKSPAQFPFPGSYALHVVAGEPQLVRILEWIGPQTEGGAVVLVTYPLRTGASGNSQLPLAELIDATPLDANERIELAKLEEGLHGQSKPRRLRLAREAELRGRAVQWQVLEKLILEGMRRRLIGQDAGNQALGMAA